MNGYRYGGGHAWDKQAEMQPASRGEWNTLEIRAVRNRVTTSLNGRLVAEFTDATGWYGSGAIGLYLRGDATARFREIRIQELAEDGGQE